MFSGGQDSTTCLVQALKEFDEVHAITFDYGQRHKLEIEVAQQLAKQLGVTAHKVMDVSLLNELAISSLTRDDIPVSHELQANGCRILCSGTQYSVFNFSGYLCLPNRRDHGHYWVCETDFSGYPDCRDEFVQAMNQALAKGMDLPLMIRTPLMWLNKAETWALADQLGALDLVRHQTLTCYNGLIGDGCGECPACGLRQAGLKAYLDNRDVIMSALKSKQPAAH